MINNIYTCIYYIIIYIYINDMYSLSSSDVQKYGGIAKHDVVINVMVEVDDDLASAGYILIVCIIVSE